MKKNSHVAPFFHRHDGEGTRAGKKSTASVSRGRRDDHDHSRRVVNASPNESRPRRSCDVPDRDTNADEGELGAWCRVCSS